MAVDVEKADTGLGSPGDEPLLKIRDLSVTLKGNRILRGVDLQVRKGNIHALIGPNGAGKTTLIRSITGAIPHRGLIRFFFRGNGRIGYVPQLLEFDRSMPITVFDFFYIMLKRTPIFLGGKRRMREKINRILAATGCEHLMERRIGDLSGGELRRVLLAQALEPKPELLLLDEPASNIDEVGARRFEKMLVELKKRQGLTILMVSHYMQSVLYVADRVTAINGRVIYEGDAQELTLSDLLKTIAT